MREKLSDTSYASNPTTVIPQQPSVSAEAGSGLKANSLSFFEILGRVSCQHCANRNASNHHSSGLRARWKRHLDLLYHRNGCLRAFSQAGQRFLPPIRHFR